MFQYSIGPYILIKIFWKKIYKLCQSGDYSTNEYASILKKCLKICEQKCNFVNFDTKIEVSKHDSNKTILEVMYNNGRLSIDNGIRRSHYEIVEKRLFSYSLNKIFDSNGPQNRSKLMSENYIKRTISLSTQINSQPSVAQR